MSLKSETLILLTCAAFALTSFGFQNGAHAEAQKAAPSQSGAERSKPSLSSLDPADVDRKTECNRLTEQECDELEMDTNTVMEPFPG